MLIELPRSFYIFRVFPLGLTFSDEAFSYSKRSTMHLHDAGSSAVAVDDVASPAKEATLQRRSTF